jgi:hypothetical protein
MQPAAQFGLFEGRSLHLAASARQPAATHCDADGAARHQPWTTLTVDSTAVAPRWSWARVSAKLISLLCE